jgi:uncharacterized membrane protein YdjX (TVP38/TMEM64 family)
MHGASRWVVGGGAVLMVCSILTHDQPQLLLLVRIAPYPYNVMNFALSASSVSLGTFALATGISLVKLGTHIAIGASLETLKESIFTHPSPLRIVSIIFGMLLGIGIFVYVYIITKQAITEAESQAEEVQMEEASPWRIVDSDDDENMGAA